MANDETYRFAVIEDIPRQNDQLCEYLTDNWPNSHVDQFYDYSRALPSLQSTMYDVVISDVMLGPGDMSLDGFKIAKALDTNKTPLLIVSAIANSEVHRGIFKALGAWDYLVKPPTREDLIHQVKLAIEYRKGALNRETKDLQPMPCKDPDLVLDMSSRLGVTWKNNRVWLSRTEIRLVEKLVAHANTIVNYEDLFQCVVSGQNKDNLRNHIKNIRQAFKQEDATFDRITSASMSGYVWHV
ncbi:MAG: response regulator transcription factor [Betaproteobacteria bacterium]|nr:response regulator transcription factor [Betaproteobacteria bacterium]